MKRTISVKLLVTKEQGQKLLALQAAYVAACNQIVPLETPCLSLL